MLPRKKILVVEDNALNREMLCAILAEQYDTLEAENGQQALEVLSRAAADIALILLDVMMPVMDGYTFLEHLRGGGSWSTIPVIVTTQGDTEQDEITALAHGATDFVSKPYRPQVILHRAASLIQLHETSAMVNQLRYDRLTGLYSKEFFYRQVRERLDEHPGTEYIILCSNIENFKLYNDVYGTASGDRLLQQAADCLRRGVGEQGICGRYTADRFLCLQERTQQTLDRQQFFGLESAFAPERLHGVTVKWGVYPITDRTVPVEQMCDRALLAADSIKGQYNRHCCIYDDTMRSRLLREQTLTAAMEAALREEQFLVYLQPKYSLRGDRMAGAEALVRWVHPQWGFMNPGEFIPLFEKNGFITKMDFYVWEHVCALLQSWQQTGVPMVPVSVNVSRADVYQADLVETLTGLTGQYGVAPRWLHLEITESAYTEAPDRLLNTVRALRERGFVVEMDDFGSGYSSLNMLTEMTLDILKLDMKFVRNETAKPVQESILPNIMELAHRKKLSVVAEGAETRDQVDRLRAAGCDYAQGYYFAKPMPAGEFTALLREVPVEESSARPCGGTGPAVPLVFVVEEDDAYRARVFAALQDSYRLEAAESTAATLERLHTGSLQRPDVIVLSMSLPGHGALEVLKVLRQNPAYWHIPVLATIPQCDVREDMALAVDTEDFLCKCHPIVDLRRRVDRLMEMADLRRHEDSLQDKANRDFLTGLLNRRGLTAAFDGLRREDLPLTLYLFDLDGLKAANDTEGHEAGDTLITAFADTLRRCLRGGDIVCRYGGDEFVAILRQMGSEKDALKRAQTICDTFAAQMAARGADASCSAGIVLCPAGDRPTEQLIERADQAMYRAKQTRKGSCCIWHPAE